MITIATSISQYYRYDVSSAVIDGAIGRFADRRVVEKGERQNERKRENSSLRIAPDSFRHTREPIYINRPP